MEGISMVDIKKFQYKMGSKGESDKSSQSETIEARVEPASTGTILNQMKKDSSDSDKKLFKQGYGDNVIDSTVEQMYKGHKVFNESDSSLSSEDLKKIEELRKTINIEDGESILNFGKELSNNLSASETRDLRDTKVRDVGGLADDLQKLAVEATGKLGDGKAPKKQGLIGSIFQKGKNQVAYSISGQMSLSRTIDKYSDRIKDGKTAISNDINSLKKQNERSLEFHQQLRYYIKASEMELEDVDNHILPKLVQLTENSSEEDKDNMMLYQKLAKIQSNRKILEGRIHDLRIFKQENVNSFQENINLQDSDREIYNILDVIEVHKLPEFKSQLAKRVKIQRGKNIINSGKQLEEAFDKLLRENSDELKQLTLEVNEESARGSVSVDTLEYAQQNLLDTAKELSEQERNIRETRKNELERLKALTDSSNEILIGKAKEAIEERGQADSEFLEDSNSSYR